MQMLRECKGDNGCKTGIQTKASIDEAEDSMLDWEKKCRKQQEMELEVAEVKMLPFSMGIVRLNKSRKEYREHSCRQVWRQSERF